jgi:hypothetical protein
MGEVSGRPMIHLLPLSYLARQNWDTPIPAGNAVASGIGIPQRVVVDIRIPVQRLRVPRLRHQGVGLEEAAQGGVVEAGVVIIQAQALLPPLAGEAAVGGEEAGLPSKLLWKRHEDFIPCL